MTLEETIEKVRKRFADEVEITRELRNAYQDDVYEQRVFKEHDALAREYAHVLMFLKKMRDMEDEQKSFNTELSEIVSKNEQFVEGLADIVQACMRNKRKEAHIDLNFESDFVYPDTVKVTILIED
jgi:ClpP class serine protease